MCASKLVTAEILSVISPPVDACRVALWEVWLLLFNRTYFLDLFTLHLYVMMFFPILSTVATAVLGGVFLLSDSFLFFSVLVLLLVVLHRFEDKLFAVLLRVNRSRFVLRWCYGLSWGNGVRNDFSVIGQLSLLHLLVNV